MHFNEFGILVDEPKLIKPYHIKDSILSFKDVARLKKKIDRNTNMKPPYKLDSLDLKLFE